MILLNISDNTNAKENKSQVFMLENIIPHYDESIKVAEKYSVVLLKAAERSNLANPEDNHDFRVYETTRSNIENLHQGQFIYHYENEFENANNNPIAKRHVFYNNLLRGKLLKKQIRVNDETSLTEITEVFSYHINVGHGNCSIIVINDSGVMKIWMIDCSEYDYLNHNDYHENIQSCFSFIQEKFSLKKIHINRFFLTHSHYDHYSGINSLIDLHNITSETVFFLNLHYAMPSENYNRLLRRIIQLRCKVIEPLSTFQTNEIEIWYPEIRTVKSLSKAYINQNVQVEANPNNSSSVLFFKLGGKSILFPGDIETEKWDTIKQCRPHLRGSNYFMISHHGSLNGHLRNQCPIRRQITNLSNCLPLTSIPVLMGRDGAYNGIYSRQVINDFPRLIYSERDQHAQPKQFLEIDWQTNQNSWV